MKLFQRLIIAISVEEAPAPQITPITKILEFRAPKWTCATFKMYQTLNISKLILLSDKLIQKIKWSGKKLKLRAITTSHLRVFNKNKKLTTNNQSLKIMPTLTKNSKWPTLDLDEKFKCTILKNYKSFFGLNEK